MAVSTLALVACGSAPPVAENGACRADCEPDPNTPDCRDADRDQRFVDPPPLPEAGPGEEMRAAHDLASEHFEEGRYDAARDGFLRLYREHPHPQFLWNAWRSAERAHRDEDAYYLFAELCPHLDPCHWDYRTVLLQADRSRYRTVRVRAEPRAPRPFTCPPFDPSAAPHPGGSTSAAHAGEARKTR